jgi:hypothetical protein
MATSKVDQIRALRERRFDNSKKPAKPVNNVINSTTTDSKRTGAKSSAERQTKWRAANPDINRERARTGMRKKRAAEKHP